MNKINITLVAGAIALSGTTLGYAEDQDITFEEGFSQANDCAKLETFDAVMECLKKIPSPKPKNVIIINDKIIEPGITEQE